MPTNTERDENPILTRADVKRAIRFHDLPESLQQKALKREGVSQTSTSTTSIRLSPDALRGSGKV